MMKKLNVPTKKSKETLLKYFNERITLREPPRIKKAHTPYFSNVLCKFHVSNICMKGDQCIFSHDFSQFNCEKGETCNRKMCAYRHEAIKATLNCSDGKGEKTNYISPFL